MYWSFWLYEAIWSQHCVRSSCCLCMFLLFLNIKSLYFCSLGLFSFRYKSLGHENIMKRPCPVMYLTYLVLFPWTQLLKVPTSPPDLEVGLGQQKMLENLLHHLKITRLCRQKHCWKVSISLMQITCKTSWQSLKKTLLRLSTFIWSWTFSYHRPQV